MGKATGKIIKQLRSTGQSSERFGNCDECRKHVSETQMNVLEVQATTIYPARRDAFPTATFFSFDAAMEYTREVQQQPSPSGICMCPPRSFAMHQRDQVQ